MARIFRARGHNADMIIRAAPAQTTPRTDAQVRQLLRLLPRYRVVLHKDEWHDMLDVVSVLVRCIPGLAPGQALHVMLEARTNGAAVVTVCLKERAEYYSELLGRHALRSTIEPA